MAIPTIRDLLPRSASEKDPRRLKGWAQELLRIDNLPRAMAGLWCKQDIGGYGLSKKARDMLMQAGVLYFYNHEKQEKREFNDAIIDEMEKFLGKKLVGVRYDEVYAKQEAPDAGSENG